MTKRNATPMNWEKFIRLSDRQVMNILEGRTGSDEDRAWIRDYKVQVEIPEVEFKYGDELAQAYLARLDGLELARVALDDGIPAAAKLIDETKPSQQAMVWAMTHLVSKVEGSRRASQKSQ